MQLDPAIERWSQMVRTLHEVLESARTGADGFRGKMCTSTLHLPSGRLEMCSCGLLFSPHS